MCKWQVTSTELIQYKYKNCDFISWRLWTLQCCYTVISCWILRTWHPTPSQYTATGHDIRHHHCIQTQDMTLDTITVYRHRTWHKTPSLYTDTGHDIPPITVYRHRTWHPTPSQYIATGHDIRHHHCIQKQDMTSHSIAVYRHRTWHPNPLQYTDTGHDIRHHHCIQTQWRLYKICFNKIKIFSTVSVI